METLTENWFWILMAIALIGKVILERKKLKENFDITYLAVGQMNEAKRTAQKKEEWESVVHHINPFVRCEINTFLNDFEMNVFEKDQEQWVWKERITKEKWNRYNAIIEMKNKWKHDINIYFIIEQENMKKGRLNR